jgi:hypothetical protein
MKPFLLGFLLIITAGRILGDVPNAPCFTLTRGDAVKVSIERMGSRSNDNARLTLVLTPSKTKEYLKFTQENVGSKMEVILTDFKRGTLLQAHAQIPGQLVKDGTISLIYGNANMACDDAAALMDGLEKPVRL